MQDAQPYKVLFVCSGNSARSILAEAILNRMAQGRFAAYSAGSDPVGHVHPAASRMLEMNGHDPRTARSKTWLEFTGPDAPRLDMVFTLCDRAAGEICPHWQGEPVVAYWDLPDPAEVPLPDQMAAFHATYMDLERRITLLTALPLAALDRLALKARLRDIGGGGGVGEMALAAGPA
ncbi:arsenate reductase ArsC [Caenispirillum salinarum]|uniref:arsenate reductase ArsC n=1 Tax=Caenispirillum salinarum TaxID=859058 RepID=UPI00384E7378